MIYTTRSARQVQGYSPEEISALFPQGDHHKINIRLYAVYQISTGQSSRKVQELYHITHNQILKWVSRFEKEGLEGLKDKKGRGRKSGLSEAQRQELKTLMKERTPLAYGYKHLDRALVDRLDNPKMGYYLQENTDIQHHEIAWSKLPKIQRLLSGSRQRKARGV